MIRALAAICLLLPLSAQAQGTRDSPEVVVTLRDSGYMLGDLLDEHVRIRLPDAMHLDADSLPLPGRVAPWLEIRHAELGSRDASGSQELIVTYQIFAETEEAARVALPEFRLKALDGANVVPVIVPTQAFLLSPGLPATLTDVDRELRPSPEPALLPEAATLLGALGALLLALSAAGYLLWRYDRLPFLPYAPGPLARLWRRWRKRRDGDLASDEGTALLREWHAALNHCAGETLYPSTLERLFQRAPFLAPLRERIETMFASSWNAFYAPATGASPPTASVLSLVRESADRERGVPC